MPAFSHNGRPSRQPERPGGWHHRDLFDDQFDVECDFLLARSQTLAADFTAANDAGGGVAAAGLQYSLDQGGIQTQVHSLGGDLAIRLH